MRHDRSNLPPKPVIVCLCPLEVSSTSIVHVELEPLGINLEGDLFEAEPEAELEAELPVLIEGAA
jgi:hypothetical protein